MTEATQPTTLYTKRGRRYVPYGNISDWRCHDGDIMRAGEFRLTHCNGNGSNWYIYNITPDNAAFLAACSIAQVAMEQAMQEAAISKPDPTVFYTPQQREIIERFRHEMAATGGLLPVFWRNSSAAEIAAAGIAAVRTAAGEVQP
jgi:hypothetical protein